MGNQKKRFRTIRHLFILFVSISALIFGGRFLWSKFTSIGLLPLEFKTAGGPVYFEVEVADTVTERMKGLMFRKEMDPDRGMIFIFEEPQVASFYMKNTYISLDMIFVGQDKKVVGILRDVPILNEKSRGVDVPSLYVVELLAGTAKRAGIEVGTEVVFDERQIKK